MVFQVEAVYLIGSTVAIGFFRHSCGRVHDTAALQGGQYSVSSKWISKVELSGSRIWDFWPKLTKAVNTKPSYVMCSQFFYTQWIPCFERADFVFFSGLQIG